MEFAGLCSTGLDGFLLQVYTNFVFIDVFVTGLLNLYVRSYQDFVDVPPLGLMRQDCSANRSLITEALACTTKSVNKHFEPRIAD
jgi:hypothetical protein